MKRTSSVPGRRGPAPTWFPLRRQLLESSVWEEDPTVRVLWVALLLIASEPGRRGTVDMTLRCLAGRACLPLEDTSKALAVLTAPDPRSRTKTADGRRVQLLDTARDWGWRVVNWEAFERDRAAAGSTLRSRRHREALDGNETDCNEMQRIATKPTKEKEKEKEKEKAPMLPSVAAPPAGGRADRRTRASKDEDPPGFSDFWAAYPRQVARKAAAAAWAAMKACDRTAAMEALPRHAATWREEGRQEKAIPHPSTWLNGERWTDKLAARTGPCALPPLVGARPPDAPAIDPAKIEAARRLADERERASDGDRKVQR